LTVLLPLARDWETGVVDEGNAGFANMTGSQTELVEKTGTVDVVRLAPMLVTPDLYPDLFGETGGDRNDFIDREMIILPCMRLFVSSAIPIIESVSIFGSI